MILIAIAIILLCELLLDTNIPLSLHSIASPSVPPEPQLNKSPPLFFFNKQHSY